MQPTTAHTKDTNIMKLYNADRSFQFMKPRLHLMNVSSSSKCHHRKLQNEIYIYLVTIRMGIYVKSNNPVT